jgi:hypothetical protein
MDSKINIQQQTYGIEHTATGKTMIPGMKPKVESETVEMRADSLAVTLPSQSSTAVTQASLDLETTASGQGASTFNSLAPADKKACRDTLMALDKNARLFVDDNGSLKRASAMEIKQCLDNGKNVFLVTSIAGENREDSSYSSGRSETVGMLTYHDYGFGASSSHSNEKSVYYSASPFSSWDDLAFADTDKKGVPGTAYLPKSGGKVLVSSEWESNWQSYSYERHGIFRITEESSEKGGRTSVSRG